jgi:hypothetical protein
MHKQQGVGFPLPNYFPNLSIGFKHARGMIFPFILLSSLIWFLHFHSTQSFIKIPIVPTGLPDQEKFTRIASNQVGAFENKLYQ